MEERKSNNLNPMDLRKRTGKTQRQIARELDKKESTISDWERRRTIPRVTLPEVKQMLEVYQCSLDELIEAFKPQDENLQAGRNN